MASRVTSSRLIGRDVELIELEDALEAAAAAEPSLFLVGGDSGIGKTRLADALRERAEVAGAVTMTGECLELAEAELPYAPIVAAVRPLARERHPVLEQMTRAERSELARLLPMVDAPPAVGDDSGAAAQARLFEALLALLDCLGRDGPALLVIEDLHWADRSTRSFVSFLARSLSDERVLVIATYRSDELHRRHPLRPLLAEIDRQPRVRRLQLEPLGRDHVREALEDILGREPERDLVDRLFTRSEGNPLYVEELLAAGADGRGPMPSSLREALMVRVERLDDQAQQLLRLLAVGQRLDHRLLSDALGVEAGELVAPLRELVANHLVVPNAEGRYVFRHALLREVIVDDLLPGERAELHLALARAFQRRADAGEGDAQVAAGIAHHFHAAGDRPAALVTSARAGIAAAEVHAYGEAAALFERALDLWDQVPDAERLACCDHVTLLVRAADAHWNDGSHFRQEALLKAALSEVDAPAEPRRAAVLLERLARAQRNLNHTDESLATARHGLADLGDDPSPERATLLGFVAKSRVLQGKYRDAADVAREALDVARTVDDRSAEVSALDALGLALIATGDIDEGRACLRQAIDMARADGRPDAMGIAYLNLADVLHLRGRHEEALDVAREGLELSVGRSRSWLRMLSAELAVDNGDWDQVETHLPHAERAVGNQLLNAQLRRAELALGRGQHERARELLAQLEAEVAETAEPQYLGPYGALLAELRRREGDLDGAREAIDDALDRLEFCTEDVMRLARVTAVGVAVEADRAQRARDLGDAAEQRGATARARELLERVRAAAIDGGPVEAAWAATAEAEDARARGKPDPKRWGAAAEAWDGLQRPYPAARTRLFQAEAYLLGDDREKAAEAVCAALAGADRLGAGWLAGEARALAARARLRLDAEAEPAQPESPAPAPREDPFGLTRRERQVLARVARGATNREIGQELFMAEKTASVHVSRILAKLDVRSRTEAAAVAHRLGLADEDAAQAV
ncbi:MAG TPA: AAA family ATPase [Thermoleophilaceae bacterium]|nr:AAA family ATPase [Thermoleophilaceae bacterium]